MWGREWEGGNPRLHLVTLPLTSPHLTSPFPDRFYGWLAELHIDSHRAGICMAVAEKANSWVPGVFDRESLGGE